MREKEKIVVMLFKILINNIFAHDDFCILSFKVTRIKKNTINEREMRHIVSSASRRYLIRR